MTSAAISGYDFSLFLHIAAVMVGLGSTFALSVTTQVAMKLDPRHMPYVHELSMVLNRYFAMPGLLLVLLTGLYQVSESEAWKISDTWISATFTIVIVIGGISGAYFMPMDRKLKAIAERDIATAGDGQVKLSDEYNQRARGGMIVGPLVGLLLVVAVYLMVVKPGI